MRALRFSVVIVLVALVVLLPAEAKPKKGKLELSTKGIQSAINGNPKQVAFDLNSATTYRPGAIQPALQSFLDVQKDPLSFPGFGTEVVSKFVDAEKTLDGQIEAAAFGMGRKAPDGDKVDASGLAEAIEKAGGSVSADDLADVPEEIQKAAARIVLAAAETKSDWDKVKSSYGRSIPAGQTAFDFMNSNPQQMSRFDWNTMLKASRTMAVAFDASRDELSGYKGKEKFEVRIDTPLGVVILNGGKSSNKYGDSDVLLILDTAGNDTYTGTAGATTGKCRVSVVLDLDGNDQYTSDESVRFGAAEAGFALIWDADGKDKYLAAKGKGRPNAADIVTATLGYGYFGTGVIVDGGGDDVYETSAFGQGCGIFGIGMIVDLGGKDQYHGGGLCQGSGFVAGFGGIIDYDGDDLYHVADPIHGDPIFNPAPQDKNHSANNAQGAGFGMNGSAKWAGGLGFLMDVKGDDTYKGGCFVQGEAYFVSMGILADLEGDDEYKSFIYSQGVGVHGGFGLMLEYDGNDKHMMGDGAKNCLGMGVDWGMGIFIDGDGNDFYEIYANSAGCSLGNSIGIFQETKGKDSYKINCGPKAVSVGSGKPYMNDGGTNHWGIFMELDGKDRYDGAKIINNGQRQERQGPGGALDAK